MQPQLINFIDQDMNQSVLLDDSREQLGLVLAQADQDDQPQAVDSLLEQKPIDSGRDLLG